MSDKTLDERVLDFNLLRLPGQMPMMHMGTSYLVSDLHNEVKRLRAERDALRRDAERYRWLKGNARRIDFAGLSWTQGCELDARIDAALREGGK